MPGKNWSHDRPVLSRTRSVHCITAGQHPATPDQYWVTAGQNIETHQDGTESEPEQRWVTHMEYQGSIDSHQDRSGYEYSQIRRSHFQATTQSLFCHDNASFINRKTDQESATITLFECFGVCIAWKKKVTQIRVQHKDDQNSFRNTYDSY